MNKTLGLQLIGFSVLLAGLSGLSYYLAPGIALPSLVAGLAGGALCFIWGLLAAGGRRGKALPILTLIPVCYILLGQAILVWGRQAEAASQPLLGSVITLNFILSVAALARIAYAGVVFSAPTTSPKDRMSK